MSPVEAVRRRRLIHATRERAARNQALRQVASGLRASAEEEFRAGHPERALPYLDEAAVFEGAVQPLPVL